MSQITYRANLSAKAFPFISENFGRSIIVPQYDNNFNRQLTSPDDVDKDVGIPQLYYCHNVMPHPQGMQSIGYTPILSGGLTNINRIFTLRDSGDNKVYLIFDTTGNTYISSGGPWAFKGNYPQAANNLVTTAFVSGTTYIYIQNYGCIKYDFGTQAFIPGGNAGTLSFAGLVITGPGAIIGICPSAGYLVAWNNTAVAWSSTIDPTDFIPSLVTGAGGGSVEGAKGSITLCVPHLLGFIVYTAANAVASLFSGNTRFPFNFREIVASGGVSSSDLIAYDANSGNHYAYTTSGFQLISTSQSQTAYPDLTDFIAGKLFEDFDEATNTFNTTVLTGTMLKRVAVISDRYMCISYGVNSFTHCIVYDLIEKRYGKLKITHTVIFEYQIPSVVITETPRQSIGILKADGSISVVDFSVSLATSSGVAIFGKYQFVRPRVLQLDEIAVENIRAGFTFSLTDMYTLDGKTYLYSTPTLNLSIGLFRRYKCRIVGLNHSLLFKGAFEVCSLVLTFNPHGKR